MTDVPGILYASTWVLNAVTLPHQRRPETEYGRNRDTGRSGREIAR